MARQVSFTLLVVDDEPDVVDALRRALRDSRYEVLGCTRPLEALELLGRRRVDLVISDLDMPEMHGLELLRRVRAAHPGTLRIVLTGRASLESALSAINQGEVHRYLTKPWEQAALRRTVEESLERLSELRSSADAAQRVAVRAEIHEALEARYPGITRVSLDGGAVHLDPGVLDASWTLADALSDSPAEHWLLSSARVRPDSGLEKMPDLEKMSGTVLEHRFKLEAPIGRGGFGVVYRALQLSLDRFVAVKLLQARGPDRDRLARFKVEALSTCRVVHPNAVSVLDAGIDERGIAYLVMELLVGETVAQRLRRGETLGFDAAASLAADLCAALAVAHDSGIMHRDIKPANVFLHQGPEGPVTKLLDFGIAKLVSPRASQRGLTAEDAILGTPAYIAPERLTGGEVDGRADVYGAGVLLYEVLSGVTPFQGASPAEIAAQQLAVHPRALGAMDRAVPSDLDALVARMLAKEPAARPTAAEAASTLRALVPRLPAARMVPKTSSTSTVTTADGR